MFRALPDPTGGPLEFETAEFSRFEGGLLAHHRVVLDMLGLARQIEHGLVEREGAVSGEATD